MLTTMNSPPHIPCGEARRQMALLIGQDLPAEEAVAAKAVVRGHLVTCPACREHRESLAVGMTALSGGRELGGSWVDAETPSVWSGVEREIASGGALRPTASRPGAMPMAAVSLACVLLVAVVFLPAGGGPGVSGPVEAVEAKAPFGVAVLPVAAESLSSGRHQSSERYQRRDVSNRKVRAEERTEFVPVRTKNF